MNIDPPAVAEKSLERGGPQDQQRILNQRWAGLFGAESRIDAALDQPRNGDTRQIRSDQRQNAEDEKTAMAVNKKFDPVVIATNFGVLWQAAKKDPTLGCARTPDGNRSTGVIALWSDGLWTKTPVLHCPRLHSVCASPRSF